MCGREGVVPYDTVNHNMRHDSAHLTPAFYVDKAPPPSLSRPISKSGTRESESERERDGGIKEGLSAHRYGPHQLPSFLPSFLLFFKQTS